MKPFKSMGLLLLSTGLFLTACDDDDNGNNPEPSANSLEVSFKHEVDGEPLVFDTMQYQNEAGETYGVTKLEYIITDFKFYKAEGGSTSIPTSQYINPEKPATTTFTLKDIPEGNYDQVSFVFGIRESKNKSGNLPQTSNFANMGWPPNNGGGYHYMRMNGRHDSAGFEDGFTTHLGHTKKWNMDTMPPTLIEDQVKSYAFEVKMETKNLSIPGDQAAMEVVMNLNNWYHNPNTYQFSTMKMEGIMKSQQKQKVLMENGKQDVFRLGNLQP